LKAHHVKSQSKIDPQRNSGDPACSLKNI